MALLELSFPDSPPDAAGLAVRHFEVQEGLNALFEVALVVMSPSAAIDLEQLVGKPARFRADAGELGHRAWAGVCFGAELLDVEEDGLSTYRVSIVPTAWLLTQRVNHRIFQHLSAPEIAVQILREWDVPVELRVDLDRHPRLEYRVQYGESDFAFVSRILEEAGISYYFEPVASGDASRMVLADGPESAEPALAPVPFIDNPGERQGGPWATGITMATDLRPGKASIVDYDFRRPRYRLTYRFEDFGAGEDALEVYRYAPGTGVVDLADADAPNDTPSADDKSRARVDEHAGYEHAGRALQGARADRRQVHFNSNVIGLAAGMAMSISGHPKPQLGADRRLIVTGVEVQGSATGDWTLTASALFADHAIRPPHKTPRPKIEGPQSALVVGPSGKEIHTDEFGRVRVRFHWDREGQYDDNRTPWVRVNEGWAGAGFGMMAIPRVGHEVIVDFYEGNPDQPVIIGRVFNGAAPPPYGLPANKSKSVWRTRSSPEGSGYHELSFEDNAGFEEVFLRSERDLRKVVKNDETETTRRDRTLIIAKDFSNDVAENDEIEAGAGHAVTMGKVENGDRVAESADPSVSEGATKREIIPGRITMSTGGATIQLDGPDVIITAETSIAIRGKEVKIQGGPYVHVNPPVTVKQGDTEKAAVAEREVWFKLISDDGQPMADVTAYVESADGATSAARKTDGRGMVRFPVDGQGNYRLVVGSPPPPAAAPAPAPTPAAASESVAAFAPSTSPAPSAAPAPAPAITPPPGPSYKVKRGDTLGKIASRNGTTLGEILRLNPSITNPDRIRVGQQITLPAAASATAPAPAPAPATASSTAPASVPIPQPRPASAPSTGTAPAPSTTPATSTAPSTAPVPQPRPAPPRVDVGQTPAQQSTVAQPTTHAVPIQIEIVSPEASTEYEIDPGGHPTPDPSMPTLKLHAKVKFQGQEITSGTLTWEFTISGRYRVRDRSQDNDRRLQEFRFSAGSARTAPGEEKDFQLAPGELVGGDLELTVTYEGGADIGNLKATKNVTQMKVKGRNPERAAVEGLIAEISGTQAWAMLRIFCHESVHRLHQFRDGEVLYGPPAGVGIVQRDPEAEEWIWPQSRITEPNNFFPRIFWDWKKNVREGVQSFRNTYIQRSRNAIDRLRRDNPNLPEAPEGLVLRGAIRAYNGGNEFLAGPGGTHYIVSPHVRRNGQIVPLNADRVLYVGQVLNDSHIDAATYPIPDGVLLQAWPARR